MAGFEGMNQVVEFLLEKVALGGDDGANIDSVIGCMKDFPEIESLPGPSYAGADQNADPRAIRALQEQGWKWLSAHPDVWFGPGKEYNKLSLAKAEEISRQQESSPGPHDAPMRIYTNATRVWQALTGHDVDWRKIPKMEFRLLTLITGAGKDGISQPDLVQLSDQDKRSVPPRTEALASKGYISKRVVITSGRRTTHLLSHRYAAIPGTKQGTAVSELLDFKRLDWARLVTVIAEIVSKAEDHIITMHHLREELHIPRNSNTVRTLWRGIEKLCMIGVIKRLSVQTPSTRAHKQVFVSAVQLVRFPTDEDLTTFLHIRHDQIRAWRYEQADAEAAGLDIASPAESAGDALLSNDDLEEETAANLDSRGMDLTEPVAEDLEEDVFGIGAVDEDTLGNDAETLALQQEPDPFWQPEDEYADVMFHLIDCAGVHGISSSQISDLGFGRHWRKPVDVVLARLSDAWEISQAPHLRYMGIVRDLAMDRRIARYVYRTFEHHAKLVAAGYSTWPAVASAKAPKAEETLELDEWGFPVLSQSLFIRGDDDRGGNYLQKAYEQAKIKSLLQSSDPEVKRRPNGELYIYWPAASRGRKAAAVASRAVTRELQEPEEPKETRWTREFKQDYHKAYFQNWRLNKKREKWEQERAGLKEKRLRRHASWLARQEAKEAVSKMSEFDPDEPAHDSIEDQGAIADTASSQHPPAAMFLRGVDAEAYEPPTTPEKPRDPRGRKKKAQPAKRGKKRPSLYEPRIQQLVKELQNPARTGLHIQPPGSHDYDTESNHQKNTFIIVVKSSRLGELRQPPEEIEEPEEPEPVEETNEAEAETEAAGKSSKRKRGSDSHGPPAKKSKPNLYFDAYFKKRQGRGKIGGPRRDRVLVVKSKRLHELNIGFPAPKEKQPPPQNHDDVNSAMSEANHAEENAPRQDVETGANPAAPEIRNDPPPGGSIPPELLAEYGSVFEADTAPEDVAIDLQESETDIDSTDEDTDMSDAESDDGTGHVDLADMLSLTTTSNHVQELEPDDDADVNDTSVNLRRLLDDPAWNPNHLKNVMPEAYQAITAMSTDGGFPIATGETDPDGIPRTTSRPPIDKSDRTTGRQNADLASQSALQPVDEEDGDHDLEMAELDGIEAPPMLEEAPKTKPSIAKQDSRSRPAGFKQSTGTLALRRNKMVLQIVENCGGVTLAGRDLSKVFNKVWQGARNASTANRVDKTTVDRIVAQMVEEDMLKIYFFTFDDSSREKKITKKIIALPEIPPSDPRFRRLQKGIMKYWPNPFFPSGMVQPKWGDEFENRLPDGLARYKSLTVQRDIATQMDSPFLQKIQQDLAEIMKAATIKRAERKAGRMPEGQSPLPARPAYTRMPGVPRLFPVRYNLRPNSEGLYHTEAPVEEMLKMPLIEPVHTETLLRQVNMFSVNANGHAILQKAQAANKGPSKEGSRKRVRFSLDEVDPDNEGDGTGAGAESTALRSETGAGPGYGSGSGQTSQAIFKATPGPMNLTWLAPASDFDAIEGLKAVSRAGVEKQPRKRRKGPEGRAVPLGDDDDHPSMPMQHQLQWQVPVSTRKHRYPANRKSRTKNNTSVRAQAAAHAAALPKEKAEKEFMMALLAPKTFFHLPTGTVSTDFVPSRVKALVKRKQGTKRQQNKFMMALLAPTTTFHAGTGTFATGFVYTPPAPTKPSKMPNRRFRAGTGVGTLHPDVDSSEDSDGDFSDVSETPLMEYKDFASRKLAKTRRGILKRTAPRVLVPSPTSRQIEGQNEDLLPGEADGIQPFEVTWRLGLTNTGAGPLPEAFTRTQYEGQAMLKVDKPPKPKRGRKHSLGGTADHIVPPKAKRPDRMKMTEAAQTRLIHACIVVGMLLHGDLGAIEWKIVHWVFRHWPDYDPDYFRDHFKYLAKFYPKRIATRQQLFGERFPQAYKRKEVPYFDPDNLIGYDWDFVVDWAIKQRTNESGKKGGVRRTVALKDIGEHYEIEAVETDKLLIQKTILSQPTTMKARQAMMKAIDMTVPLDRVDTSVSSLSEFETVKSLVRANFATPQDQYDHEVGAARFKGIPRSLISNATAQLHEEKVIASTHRGPMVPQRNWYMSDKFDNALNSQHKHKPLSFYATAVAAKFHLDEIFKQQIEEDRALEQRSGASSSSTLFRPTFTIHTEVSDGLILVLTHLQEAGRLTLRSQLPPVKDDVSAKHPKLSKWGYLGYSYETRKLKANRFNFRTEVSPTEAYHYGSGEGVFYDLSEPAPGVGDIEVDISSTPAPGQLHSTADKGKRKASESQKLITRKPNTPLKPNPAWVDISGNLIPKYWTQILAGVIQCAALKHQFSPREMARAFKGFVNVWEIGLVGEWLVRAGVFVRAGGGGGRRVGGGGGDGDGPSLEAQRRAADFEAASEGYLPTECWWEVLGRLSSPTTSSTNNQPTPREKQGLREIKPRNPRRYNVRRKKTVEEMMGPMASEEQIRGVGWEEFLEAGRRVGRGGRAVGGGEGEVLEEGVLRSVEV
ncbi:hypothetical protein K402DRAFT_467670 [Aulographum hederae CBS 113979]|uniref:Uncharacterized protein n=1 Tax=Aulographum hederae CBS 113979 TaxID=1176131 RepID=A0A6G1GKA5_9PEZI|nr:hypothetical protein K402DRAFT_467670 [Aulographum hederae CBS 113979]